jgi:hypothetical protein
MARNHTLTQVAALLLLALVGRAVPAWSQEPVPAPTPAAAPAPPAAPAVDSNLLWVGDWDYTAQLRDSTIEGVWRINYTNGRFSGIAQRSGKPPAPISSISVRDHYRNITLTAYFDGESYTFSGHLDNPRTITGMLTTRGMARFRAVKR